MPLENCGFGHNDFDGIPAKIENERKDNCTIEEEIEVKTPKGQRIEVKKFVINSN